MNHTKQFIDIESNSSSVALEISIMLLLHIVQQTLPECIGPELEAYLNA